MSTSVHRAHRFKNLLQWTVTIILILGVYLWQTRDLLDSGEAIEQHQLPTLGGGTATLLADNKPSLIYFFVPWCQICSLSIGNLEQFDADEIAVKAVALDYASVEAVQDFVDEHKVRAEVLLGHQALKQAFRLRGYPTYYIVDSQGEIQASDMGYSSSVGMAVRHWLATGR
ncbi:hypothetical protein HMF8227_01681 [Saliniradius amylolyticus]|uniref:Thioredoxin domain-containing protein n=1 Tax=Saliniradius amylolyticus TaxID=2183582 RepID=A0A2S2E3D5_9ALTE|nr:redoxin domain-containing protein [Saliniradius amylolyticus]AWL12154.1 hypothetical protein HMF8227_01681 [Saliniradius amylolyticus]